MATPTYTALATTTLSGGETSVTFSSIPATYRDLVLVCNATNAGGIIDLTLNSDSSNRTSVYAYGYPTSGTGSFTDTTFAGLTSTTIERLHIYQIMDYSATDKHKTVLIRHNYTNSIVSMAAGRWASTAAVHTVALTKTSLSFASGSVISLYGIEA